ncbi:MAG: hypothetical protein JWL77_266 [Chthonomonadaceae bacterium]|nr:hypothetical protein [Chthonomonadaceae bacterium]
MILYSRLRTRMGGISLAMLLGSGLWLLNAHAQPLGEDEKSLTFANPMAITNPYLPLSRLHQDILEGKEDGKKIRIERTMKPGTRTFLVHGKKVTARLMEDREFEDGKLTEVTLDYIAQADDGAVCYMGEKVDEYTDGKVSGHKGAWLTGEHNALPGVLFPAHPKVGDTFHSENVPGIAVESDEIVSVDETVTVPSGTYKHCVKVKESVEGEEPEYKYYAPNVGVVREVPHGGDVRLISHK